MLKKVQEELLEVQNASSPEQQFEEMGDVLFMVAKAARWLNVDAEKALRQANRKFRQRVQVMEEIIRQEGRAFSSYNSQEWSDLWSRAKQE